MKLFPNGLNYPRQFVSLVFRYAARHLVVLATLVLAATGAIGGSIFGLHTFAAGPCAGSSRTYYVVWGDTLSGIAYRYGSTVARLASYNAIANPNLIFPEERICIPSSQAPIPTYSSGGISVASQSYYVLLARQDAINAGISPDIFVRQINEESGFQPYVVSWAGAIGIAQFMPATAASMGINPYNPAQSLWGAAHLMASYVRQYDSYAMALAAYNAGPGAVYRSTYSCGGYWEECLPTETRNYIGIILGE